MLLLASNMVWIAAHLIKVILLSRHLEILMNIQGSEHLCPKLNHA